MRKPVPSRRLVALAAAYVVALQALLLPLAVAAGSPLIGVLCTSSPVDTQAPVGHESGCGCAAGCGMQCGVQALAPPPQVTAGPARTSGYVLTATPALLPVVRPVERGPQIPRAPPAA
ncbi:MAG: hypothetical protein K9G60_12810 [Pseudolabrys sp.]|nr:hypothetical protein [Pseudolabrys sp.]